MVTPLALQLSNYQYTTRPTGVAQNNCNQVMFQAKEPQKAVNYAGDITSNGASTLGASGPLKWCAQKWNYLFGSNDKYKSVDDKGISDRNCRQTDTVLAQYGQKVATDMNTEGGCYTGVKHSLLSAGVIKDYGDMPKGDAKSAKEFFDLNSSHFTKVPVNSVDDLKKLPAGHIVVYQNNEPGRPGHIAITNGNGQEYSDHTGNMNWNKEHGGGYAVYKLSDKWNYDPKTKKLSHPEELQKVIHLPEIKPTGVNLNDCPSSVTSPI